ncbi:heme exporter protein CcmD [Marinicellulosiphila megalodicopiae]|uniref:heme exporter protein CcmD n=1 Tax=Marinicellulosiphila megalodicopiae TaxID=2724896 RepID=UPI003BB1E677
MIFENLMDAVQMCSMIERPINGVMRESITCRGGYVWACYAIGLSVIGYYFLSPIIRTKKLIKQEARRRLSESL